MVGQLQTIKIFILIATTFSNIPRSDEKQPINETDFFSNKRPNVVINNLDFLLDKNDLS